MELAVVQQLPCRHTTSTTDLKWTRPRTSIAAASTFRVIRLLGTVATTWPASLPTAICTYIIRWETGKVDRGQPSLANRAIKMSTAICNGHSKQVAGIHTTNIAHLQLSIARYVHEAVAAALPRKKTEQHTSPITALLGKKQPACSPPLCTPACGGERHRRHASGLHWNESAGMPSKCTSCARGHAVQLSRAGQTAVKTNKQAGAPQAQKLTSATRRAKRTNTPATDASHVPNCQAPSACHTCDSFAHCPTPRINTYSP